MSKYPSPDSLDLPAAPRRSPDQKYYEGWVAQHNRLWMMNLALMALVVVLVSVLFMQTQRYRPAVQLTTIDGRAVTTTDGHTVLVGDSLEYSPVRVMALVKSFVETRYAYDYEQPGKVLESFRYMSPEAAEREKQKLAGDTKWYQNVVLGGKAKVSLDMEWESMKVVAVGPRSFKVTIDGKATVNTATNPAPNAPVVKPATLSFTVQQVAPTETNLLGYVVIATDTETIL